MQAVRSSFVIFQSFKSDCEDEEDEGRSSSGGPSSGWFNLLIFASSIKLDVCFFFSVLTRTFSSSLLCFASPPWDGEAKASLSA
jgi:hypothetical protein